MVTVDEKWIEQNRQGVLSPGPVTSVRIPLANERHMTESNIQEQESRFHTALKEQITEQMA